MNIKFDELTKKMAQSVTRRAALKHFGGGLLAALAVSLGIRSAAAPPKKNGYCVVMGDAGSGSFVYTGACVDPTTCSMVLSSDCTGKASRNGIATNPCDNGGSTAIDTKKPCSF